VSVDVTLRLDAVQLKSDDRTVVLQQGSSNVIAAGVAGPAGSLSYCGAFSSTQTQSVASDSAAAMTLNTTDISVGVSVENSSQIVIASPGVWNVQFSAQILKSSGGSSDVSIWLAQNGSPVANSATDVRVQGNGQEEVAAWNWVIRTTTVNEYVELMWSHDSGTVSLYALGTRTAPVRPAVPSVIATVTPVLVNPW
jgi:hypothetical protein